MAKKEKEVAEKPAEQPKPDVPHANQAKPGQTYAVVGKPKGLSLK